MIRVVDRPQPAGESAWEAQSGFTLIELLVGLTLLAYLAMNVMTLSVLAVHLNDLAEERTIATSLATERIQRITSVPFQAAPDYLRYKLPQETATAGPPQTFTADYGEIPEHPEFKRIVELNYNVPSPGMLSVETRISWRHVADAERTHTMVTYINPALD